jgi:OOP family OmpA-OmpF porin
MKKIALLAIILGYCSQDIYSQGILNRIKDKVANSAARKAEEAIDKPSSKSSKKSVEEDEDEGASAENVSTAKTVTTETAEPAKENKLASKSRFDFVPGEKVVFYEDFSGESIGEFPSKWFTRSKGETVTLNNVPGNWMRMYPGGFLSPTVNMKENYTVEFDMIMDWPIKGGYLVPSFGIGFYDRGAKTYVFSYDYRLENNMSFHITPFRSEAYVTMSSRENSKPKFDSEKMQIASFDKKSGKVVHVSISVQQERLRMWLDEEKVFDIPSAAPYPGNFNQLKVEMNSSNYTNDQIGYYVSNFKIATGAPDLKSKLVDEGKLVTTGIRFDNNSDNIRNESYGTINEIAKVIKANPELKIRIVGHTDATGSAADNLALSKKRADAVIKVLTENYSIPSSQMQADGKGSTAPVGDNKTAEGRAMNRRVEFIKM